MPEFSVRLAGSQVSGDGSVTKLATRDVSSGEDVTLPFPSEQLEILVAALSQASSAASRIRQKDPCVEPRGAVVGPITQWASATLAYAAIGGTRRCQSCAAW
jgi:hypothetical protein